MSLLSPWMLLGALGLAIPVIAHLLGNERPVRVDFAGTRFLRSQEPTVTQRRRIHDWPLLLLRLALLLGLIIALARPVSVAKSNVGVVADPHDAVLLIDASASMELRVDGTSERQRAVTAAASILDALPAGSRVAFMTNDPRGPIVELGDRRARVIEAIEQWGADDVERRLGSWSLASAVGHAATLFEPSDGDRPRVVYAIGDATDRGIGSLPASVDGRVRLVPVPTRDVADDAVPPTPEHIGITSALWEPAPDLDADAVRVQAIVARHGPFTARVDQADELEVTAVLRVDGDEVARASTLLTPNSSAPIEFTHNLAAAGDGAMSKVAAVTVELLDAEDDPLPIDDERYLWLASGGAASVLVVNGDPSEQRANDEVFFATTALSASEATRVDIAGLAPDQLEDRVREYGSTALSEVDVLLLANVRAPSPEASAVIRQRVEEGMGLLISVGDRVVPADYNARFVDILPLPLRSASFTGSAPGRMDARNEGIAPVQLSHPMFADLEADLDLGATRTRRVMLLEPDPSRAAEIAVSFTSGAPALITREVADGKVALLATTIDRDWGDLPLRPGFVPLVEHLINWLAGTQAASNSDEVFVGQPRALPPGVPFLVHAPDGDSVPIGAGSDVEPAQFAATDRPGHYRAETRDGDGGEDVRFVVTVDPRESDTEPVTAHADDAEGEGSRASVPVHEPRWRVVLWLCVLLLLAESTLRLLGRRRR